MTCCQDRAKLIRTLQRRVRAWRGVMAKELVYATHDERILDQGNSCELVLARTGTNG